MMGVRVAVCGLVDREMGEGKGNETRMNRGSYRLNERTFAAATLYCSTDLKDWRDMMERETEI